MTQNHGQWGFECLNETSVEKSRAEIPCSSSFFISDLWCFSIPVEDRKKTCLIDITAKYPLPISSLLRFSVTKSEGTSICKNVLSGSDHTWEDDQIASGLPNSQVRYCAISVLTTLKRHPRVALGPPGRQHIAKIMRLMLP